MTTPPIVQSRPQDLSHPLRPPLDWIILKISQLCNLNCTYCYVYNRGDESWRSRPAAISNHVVSTLADRIQAHCVEYSMSMFHVELHGGEPLLIGKKAFEEILINLREGCSSTRLLFHLQTNGLLLDGEWLELFDRFNVTFGLSLDGPPELADRHRIYHSGRGSTEDLLERIRRVRLNPLFEKLFGGVLCVVSDPTFSAEALLRWFVENGFFTVDFLLPDGNYANLPQQWAGPEPYARFLVDAFHAWCEIGEPSLRIRLFEYMVVGLTGQEVALDSLGGDLRQLCVVESDGSIGVSDVARICDPLAKDKLSIFTSRLDEHGREYDLLNLQKLSSQCKSCEYLNACGGGYLPHRFDGETFENPSLYCKALYSLANAIFKKLKSELPAELFQAGSQ
jgi:uncharacterized protein